MSTFDAVWGIGLHLVQGGLGLLLHCTPANTHVRMQEKVRATGGQVDPFLGQLLADEVCPVTRTMPGAR